MKTLLITACLLLSIPSLQAQCLDFETFYSLKDKDLKGVRELLGLHSYTIIKHDDSIFSEEASGYIEESYELKQRKQQTGINNDLLSIAYMQSHDTTISILWMTVTCTDLNNYLGYLDSIRMLGFRKKKTKYTEKGRDVYTLHGQKYPFIIDYGYQGPFRREKQITYLLGVSQGYEAFFKN